jgi:hypothetical protein
VVTAASVGDGTVGCANWLPWSELAFMVTSRKKRVPNPTPLRDADEGVEEQRKVGTLSGATKHCLLWVQGPFRDQVRRFPEAELDSQ